MITTYFNNLTSLETALDKAVKYHASVTAPISPIVQMKYNIILREFNRLMVEETELDSDLVDRLVIKLSIIHARSYNFLALKILLPYLVQTDIEAAETLVDRNPMAEALAKSVSPFYTETNHIEDPLTNRERFSSLYNRIKTTARETRRWNAYNSGLRYDENFTYEEHKNFSQHFNQRLRAWQEKAGENEDRAEAAARINAAPRHLDLRGLGLKTIPEVVICNSIKSIYIDHTTELEHPAMLHRAPQHVILTIIKAKHAFFTRVAYSLQTNKAFIVEALRKNPAVLQCLPQNLQEDREFLLAVARVGIGIIPYITSTLKDDPSFMRTLVQAFAFGEDKWNMYFGDIKRVPLPLGSASSYASLGILSAASGLLMSYFRRENIIPELPGDILERLCSNDPYETDIPRKKVGETHMLFLLPSSVDGKMLTMSSFSQLTKNPLKGNLLYSDFDHITAGEPLIHQQGTDTAEWCLMRKEAIPGSWNLGYGEQKQLLSTVPGYFVPSSLRMIVGIMTNHVRNTEVITLEQPTPYLRTSDLVGSNTQFQGYRTAVSRNNNFLSTFAFGDGPSEYVGITGALTL